jgi:hypothetical protein
LIGGLEMNKSKTRGEGRRLVLNDIGAARRALARICRGAWAETLTPEKTRLMAYTLSLLVNAFKAEAELSIEARLAALEEKVRK